MMKRLLTAAVAAFSLCAATAALVSHAAVIAQSAATPRAPRNVTEYEQLAQKLSNWGRWGKDDQLGAANLITPAKRKQAAGLVKEGISLSLDRDAMTEVSADNPRPWEHTMNPGFTTDTYKVSYHGYAHSHMDALCHYPYKDQLYNGFAKADVNTEKGCAKLGIEHLKAGILTRGVIIDIPRLKGVPYLEPGTPIFPEDLDAWEKETGAKVGAGDAVFVRTGRWARRDKLGPWKVGENVAGLHASAAPWFKARDVAVVGGDGPQDVIPSMVEGVNLPVHSLLLVSMGVYIFDQMDLEAVAKMAAKLNRVDFMFAAAPTPIVGGTGFPLNAIATF